MAHWFFYYNRDYNRDYRHTSDINVQEHCCGTDAKYFLGTKLSQELNMWKWNLIIMIYQQYPSRAKITINFFVMFDITETKIPSSFYYKARFSRQLNCWYLRCGWSIACRRCSNYIFCLHLIFGFNILRKGNFKPKGETFQFCDLVRLI